MTAPKKNKKKKPGEVHVPTVTEEFAELREQVAEIVPDAVIFSESPSLKDVTDWVPTGFPWLDLVISGGRGFPVGRVVQISGKFGVGKSALCESLVRSFQDKEMYAAWLDFEVSLSPSHLASYGVLPERFLYTTPDSIEQGFDIVNAAMEKQLPTLFVWDSVTAAQPNVERDAGGMDETKRRPGAHALSYSMGMRGINARLANANSTLVFINQLRQNIQTQGFAANKWTRSGGVALDFYSHLILQITKIKTLTKGSDHNKRRTGAILKIEAVKTKFAPEGAACEIILSYKRGLDKEASLLHFLKKRGKVKAAGRKGVRIEGSEETFKENKWRVFFRDNRDLVNGVLEDALEELKEVLHKDD